jgi:hypothetical protein
MYMGPGEGEYEAQPGSADAMGYDDLEVIESHRFLRSIAEGTAHRRTLTDDMHSAAVLGGREACLGGGARAGVTPCLRPAGRDAGTRASRLSLEPPAQVGLRRDEDEPQPLSCEGWRTSHMQVWRVRRRFGPKGFASVVYGLLVLQAGIPQAGRHSRSSQHPVRHRNQSGRVRTHLDLSRRGPRT